jgi:hypothetical protein
VSGEELGGGLEEVGLFGSGEFEGVAPFADEVYGPVGVGLVEDAGESVECFEASAEWRVEVGQAGAAEREVVGVDEVDEVRVGGVVAAVAPVRTAVADDRADGFERAAVVLGLAVCGRGD